MSESLLSQVGFLDENLHYCMDLDLFARIISASPLFYRNQKPICFYRTHNMTKTFKSSQFMKNEAIEIARKYSPLLQRRDWQKILRLILYSTYLEECWTGQRDKKIADLLKIVIELPLESLTDTRFLGLIKKALLNT
jgi:hypothetical protein